MAAEIYRFLENFPKDICGKEKKVISSQRVSELEF